MKKALPFKVSPIGIPSALTWNDFAFISNFVDEASINLFIEIGAYMGGLAAPLSYRTIYRPDFSYLGIEILDYKPDQAFRKELTRLDRAELIIGDCFDDQIVDRVRSLISRSGRVVVFCDGQNKPKEIKVYHELLKPNDFLLIHDFSEEKHSASDPARVDVIPIISTPDFIEDTPAEWEGMTSLFLIRRV